MRYIHLLIQEKRSIRESGPDTPALVYWEPLRHATAGWYVGYTVSCNRTPRHFQNQLTYNTSLRVRSK